MSQEKIKKSVISYHTFIFPFLFDSKGQTDRKQFLKCLPPLGKGLREDTVDWNAIPSKSLFDQYRYFNHAARNAIYTEQFDDTEVVWNYRYDLEYMFAHKNGGHWIESKKDDTNTVEFVIKHDSFQAKLAINSVRLKLFNTGIGMLAFELENYELPSERDIISINEFGRRIFMPYIISDEKRVCNLCADNISLTYDGKTIAAASGAIGTADSSKADQIPLAPFIHFFLSNADYTVTTSTRPSNKEFYIEPIIDDRMFVACLYCNDQFTHNMAKWDEQNQTYQFLSHAERFSPDADANYARQLYEMMFIDGNGMTCHCRSMLKEQLQKHLYLRWLEYGTITGITEYGMITVVSTPGFGIVSSAFLTEYIEMIYLVLAQRASLLAFERAISDITHFGYKLKVDDVQRRYVMFQSQLLLQEVTAQQQGIELYAMLLDNLFINQQQTGIEYQIKSLFELNTSSNEKSENIILFLLATLGLVECVDTFCGNWLNNKNVLLPCITLIIIAILVVYNFFGKKISHTLKVRRKNRKKKEQAGQKHNT